MILSAAALQPRPTPDYRLVEPDSGLETVRLPTIACKGGRLAIIAQVASAGTT